MLQQTLSEGVTCNEKPEVTEVTVEFKGNGNINSTTSIENIYGIDMKSSNVVGLIGAPIEITTTSEFDTAEITFSYDKTKLGDTPEENLVIMWYDEEHDWYQIMDKESTLNKTDGTISCVTTHFSKYMVVDKEVWFETWRRTIDYRDGVGEPTYYDFSFIVDTSGSMSGNSIKEAKSALHGFIDSLTDQDDGCIVRFENYASLVKGFGSTKAALHSGVDSLYATGGTNVNAGLTAGIDQLINHSSQNKKVAILICDGDVNNVTSVVEKAVKNNIAIYTINVVSSSQATLEWIAKQTGGEYYYAYTAEQLLDAFSHIASDNLFDFSLQDSDHDGLPDTFETNGMRTSNGQIVYTNPLKYDTDGDGISDGEEMGILRSGVQLDTEYEPIPENGLYLGNGKYIKSTFYFDWKSNPNVYDKRLTTGDKDKKYLSTGDFQKVVALQYILLQYGSDSYVADNLLNQIASIRRNCTNSNEFTADEKNYTALHKTTKAEITEKINFTKDLIKEMHVKDDLFWGGAALIGGVPGALSTLALLTAQWNKMAN